MEINLNGAVDNSVTYSNPVKDFLTLEKIENISWFSDKTTVELEEDSDKGFIDFLADIEENTNELTNTINCLNEDMNEMNEGVNKSTAEINRVNQTGGSGTASFVRKETKKIAKIVDTFSGNLRERNLSMSSLWDAIEKNTLGLLENEFATSEENKEELINYLRSLHNMQNSITESNISVDGLKNAMEKIMGLERSLTQAIRFVVSDLSSYLVITDRMKTSIDKILSKSKFVVGEID